MEPQASVDGKQQPPAGLVSLSLNNKQMEKYCLKTGPGRGDVLTHLVVKTVEAVEEVTKLGFYSGWYDARQVLKDYKGNDFLLVADKTGRYGENWYLCLTEESRSIAMKVRAAADGILRNLLNGWMREEV